MRMLVLVCGVLMFVAGCNRTPSGEVVEAHYGATLQDWINDLRAGSDEQRIMAAIALGTWEQAAKDALPSMIVALKDRDPRVRMWIARSMAYVDPSGEDVQVHLSAATRDPVAVVRMEAIKSLGRIGPPAWQAVDELERILDDEEEYAEVRRAVVQTSGFIGPGAAKLRPKLLELEEKYPDDDVLPALVKIALDKIDKK